MKYFTHDFFNLEGEEGNHIRSINTKKYWDEFDSCAGRLPKSFVKYYKDHRFHDNVLEKLVISKRRTKDKTSIDISTQFSAGKLIYEIDY